MPAGAVVCRGVCAWRALTGEGVGADGGTSGRRAG